MRDREVEYSSTTSFASCSSAMTSTSSSSESSTWWSNSDSSGSSTNSSSSSTEPEKSAAVKCGTERERLRLGSEVNLGGESVEKGKVVWNEKREIGVLGRVQKEMGVRKCEWERYVIDEMRVWGLSWRFGGAGVYRLHSRHSDIHGFLYLDIIT